MATNTLKRQESASLTALLDEVGKFPPLTTAEEQRLAAIIAASPKNEKGVPEDQEAIDAVGKLVSHNMLFAVSRASQFGEVGLPLEDLVGAAAVGLYEAAIRFKPGHGARFTSYAVMYIKSSIQREVSRTSGAISYPVNAMSNLSSLLKFREMVGKDSRFEGEVDLAEFAKFAGIGKGEASAIIAFAHRLRMKRESAVYAEREDKARHFEPWDLPNVTAVAGAVEAPDAVALSLDHKHLVERLLLSLSPAQRRAVKGVFWGGLMPAEVARMEGCSRQAVDMRLQKAKANMRRYYARLVAMGKVEG